MKAKYSIKVMHGDKELYHTCVDLTKYGRATINHPDRFKRNSISRILAIKSKGIIERGLLYPPLNSRDSHQVKTPFSLVALPTDAVAKEKKFSNYSWFLFQRKK